MRLWSTVALLEDVVLTAHGLHGGLHFLKLAVGLLLLCVFFTFELFNVVGGCKADVSIVSMK